MTNKAQFIGSQFTDLVAKQQEQITKLSELVTSNSNENANLVTELTNVVTKLDQNIQAVNNNGVRSVTSSDNEQVLKNSDVTNTGSVSILPNEEKHTNISFKTLVEGTVKLRLAYNTAYHATSYVFIRIKVNGLIQGGDIDLSELNSTELEGLTNGVDMLNVHRDILVSKGDIIELFYYNMHNSTAYTGYVTKGSLGFDIDQSPAMAL